MRTGRSGEQNRVLIIADEGNGTEFRWDLAVEGNGSEFRWDLRSKRTEPISVKTCGRREQNRVLLKNKSQAPYSPLDPTTLKVKNF